MVFSSQVPAALSQSALVFGASCAKAGAETASRRPVMSAKLTVFICVSYLLEHLKMPVFRTLHWDGRSVFKRSRSLFVRQMLPHRMPKTFRERYPPPWRVEEMPGGYRVVSSNGFTVAWIYSLARRHLRSADPLKLTHAEARTMAQAIVGLAQ